MKQKLFMKRKIYIDI